MSIVDFNTSIWKDSWFRKLSTKAKNLFVFLWTNDHKNLACLYEIDIETISFYTGLSIKDVKDTLSILYPKVKYDFENEVIWVVNFVRHQFMRTEKTSPKIKAGINNNLVQNNGHFFIKEFLEEYQELGLSYLYPINTVSEGYQYPPGGGGGEGEGNKKGKNEKITLPDWLPVDLWDEFKKYRTKIKKPLGLKAEQLNIAKLEKLKLKGNDPIKVIEETIMRGWQGFFELKDKQKERNNLSSKQPLTKKEIDKLNE